MGLRLILGSSGQGKTTYMMEEVIRESMKNPSQKYYVIVPEQFGVEMQREMVKHHPRHGFSNIDILSFYRLAYLVFDECGYQPKEILEDLGVAMILKRILMKHEEELAFFKKTMHYPGFLDELKSMLMEFMNYGIRAGDMESAGHSIEGYPGLSEKCIELSKIFQWFYEETSEQFMVTGQILDVLKTMVPDSKILREGIFYMDGFTGFTPIQLHFLKELLPQSRGVTVTVTIPYLPGGNRKEAKEDVFSFSEKTIYSLWDLCKESHTPWLEPVILEEENPPRYGENQELAHLERNIFHHTMKPYEGEVEKIHIISCKNPEEEAEFVCHKIEELVRKKGYRYRDFAVLMGNEIDYPAAFLRNSQIINLPLFLDTRQKMTYHTGVETIRALFHLVEKDYSYESVFRYLKSGMSDFARQDVDFLENYVLSSGVRGLSMWKKPFTRRLQGREEEEIRVLEQLRLDLLRETQSFVEGMKKKDSSVKEKMELLYHTLCALHFPEKYKEKAEIAKKENDYVKEYGYHHFFQQAVSLLDKFVAIFGDEVMEMKELAELFDAGLETLSLSSAPLSMDQVILGDLKRTRLPEIKVLFFVGMNDGDIPPVPEDLGILNDDERRILQENGVTLSLNLTERVLEDEYYMYLAFAKPQDTLYLSYSDNASDGSSKRSSILFTTIKKVFPNIQKMNYPDQQNRYYFNAQDSKESLIRQLKNWHDGMAPSDRAFYVLLAYWKKYHAEELQELYDNMEEGLGWLPLEKDVAGKLYGKDILGSVTRMESFASCPYHYFCDYGLKLTEREEFKVRSMDLGNLFHAALEHFSEHLKEEGYSWKNIPQEQKEQFLEEAVEASLDKDLRDVMESSSRNSYKKKMVLRILQRTVEVLQHQLRNSAFEPDRFELHFGPGDGLDSTMIPLEDGHKMAFQGTIDRVDLWEKDEKIYLKIIDYKSGTRVFDFTEMYHGLQMQLMVYMNAAMEIYRREKGKGVEPAGVFYYGIKDPLHKEEEASDAKRWEAFRMSGYANGDQEVLEKIEEGVRRFESIPVNLKSDGTPDKRSSVLQTEDFYSIGDYVNEKMRHFGNRIYSGEIAPGPYKYQKKTACDYCPYSSVCGFEEGRPGHRYHNIFKEKDEDIIAKIREEVD